MSSYIVSGRSQPHHREPPQPARRCDPFAARLLVATALIALAPSIAVAADMPVKAPAAPAPYNWTGCYVGLNGGAGASGSSFTSTVDPAGTHLPTPADAAEVANDGTGSANDSNIIGGGQAGCNWQTGTLVFGLEGDFDYFRNNPQFANNTNVLPSTGDPFVIAQSLKTDYLATVRPRFGVAADRNFAYVTGGTAFTHVNYAESYADALLGGALPGAGLATGEKSLIGWVIGAGWEYGWADHWTFKVEYLFAKFGTTSASGLITDAAGGTNAFQGSADLTIQTLRGGVNFKF